MTTKHYIILLTGMIFLLIPNAEANHKNSYDIIPYPQELIECQGKFAITKQTAVICNTDDITILNLVQKFIQQFQSVSGIKLSFSPGKDISSNKIMFLKTSFSEKEEYHIDVNKSGITIQAATAEAFFYALQTLYQLMPPDIYGKQMTKNTQWPVPCVAIKDHPRFKYRGLHLDVARHFFSVDSIKKFIDAMAIHKLNVFHWHLTDDQGWRLEIKKYPKLTETGSKRKETLIGHSHEHFPRKYDNKPYSGYYTQEEAREIVKYAQDRFITVIPEIEMPGHAQAALASYPFLSCTQDSTIEVITRWGVFKEVFCPREETFDFLENVLSEVLDIFPGKYIHIGGDECPKERWKECPDCQNRIKTLNLKDENELQSYFIKRIENYLNSKGRQIIGWDEILEGGVAPNATVMSWRGNKGGIEASKSQHNVIMTPMSHCYFDFYQFDQIHEPLAIGGLVDLKKVYEYNPVPPDLNESEKKYILGAQANLWAEYIPSYTHVEYMAYPRVSALSEVLWSSEEKDWESFRKRMVTQYKRYEKSGINSSEFFNDVIFTSNLNENNELEVVMESYNPTLQIRYTTDGKQPCINSKLYKGALKLSETTTYTAATFLNGKKTGKDINKQFIVSKATGKKYTPDTGNFLYHGGSEFALTNGLTGNKRVSTAHWVGFDKGENNEIIVDLESEQIIHKVEIGLLHNPSKCIYIPPKIEIYVSQNGKDYKFAGDKKPEVIPSGTWDIYRPEIVFSPITARYVKVFLEYAGFCTPDRPSGGIASLTLVDEIAIW